MSFIGPARMIANMVSSLAMGTFIKHSHWRSAHREATAGFQLQDAASGTLVGIQHKILTFYYIMCKQDIYSLTTEGREIPCILAHLCAQFTQYELCMKSLSSPLIWL